MFFRDGWKICQIDHLVISRYGIFVIEAKNYQGVIYGDGRDKMLRRKVLGMNYKTRNPIDQNDWHIRYLIDHFPAVREIILGVVTILAEIMDVDDEIVMVQILQKNERLDAFRLLAESAISA